MSKDKKVEKFEAKKEMEAIVAESQKYLEEYNGLVEGINQATARQKELLSLVQLNNGKIQGIQQATGEVLKVENKKQGVK